MTALPILPMRFSPSLRSFLRISAERNSGVISRPSNVRLNSTLPMWRLTRSTTWSGSSMAAPRAAGANDHVPRFGQHDQAGRFDRVVFVGNRHGVAFLVQLGQRREGGSQVDANRVAGLEFHGELVSNQSEIAWKEAKPTTGEDLDTQPFVAENERAG